MKGGTITLRSYQEVGVDWLRAHPRGILGDDVGLGKSFTALGAISETVPTMIICPAYLQWQWIDENLVPFYGEWIREHCVIVTGEVPTRAKLLAPGKLFYITGYHTFMDRMLVKLRKELLLRKWEQVILDEAHLLRGHGSQWTKNMWKMHFGTVEMLTGTPIVNNPGDLYPLLRLCDPKKFTSYWQFVEAWCVMSQTPWAIEVGPVRTELLPAWHKLLDQYMLRRMLRDYLPEIPKEIQHIIPVVLTPQQQRAHDRAKKTWIIDHPDARSAVPAKSGGALVTKLRQLTSGFVTHEDGTIEHFGTSPKIDVTINLIKDKPDEYNWIVFTWFRESAELVRKAVLDSTLGKDRDVYILHGDHAAEERAARVSKWKEKPNSILIATQASLQAGANLQNCWNVIFYEDDYLPATRIQALGRLVRSGQEERVQEYHIQARKTVDGSVWRTQQRRDSNNLKALIADLYSDTEE